jgi:hypothetical protein
MANQVAPRLSGDDYQHLYAWQFVLELKMPNKKVRRVTVEDALAGSVDDVTVQHELGTHVPDTFHQVKYHVDQRGEYSTQSLITHKPGEASLLEKFWRTWKLLKQQDPQRSVELHLVSNWTWDTKDKLRGCFDGRDGSIQQEFLTATPRSDLGKLRKLWKDKLGASAEEFGSFVQCLRFTLGYHCTLTLEKHIAERMEFLHLRSDENALLIAAGIVRGWVKAGRQEVTIEDLEATLRKHDLYLPENAERCVTVYITTIKAQKFDIEPDHIVDWREHFAGDPQTRGHQLKDPSEWNTMLLPELQSLAARVNEETDCRLVHARGLSRLSAWFAFGHTFSEVARYTIEVDQNGRLWRTDAEPVPDLSLLITSENGCPDGERLDGKGQTVAVGLSVTGELDEDVRNHLAYREEEVAALLLLRPDRELGRDCLRSAGDAVALADGFKRLARPFAKRWSARRLLLYYFGPLSGACFIGHKLNAIAQEVQIMEDQQPGYAPSFLLR